MKKIILKNGLLFLAAVLACVVGIYTGLASDKYLYGVSPILYAAINIIASGLFVVGGFFLIITPLILFPRDTFFLWKTRKGHRVAVK
jgi:hypothetical protein